MCYRREEKFKRCLRVTFKMLRTPVTFLYSDPAFGAMISVSFFCYEKKILILARNEVKS